jgi:uncharacterized protein (TIGR02594 family)
MVSVREIQTALSDKGFDPGGIDGIWGRKSIRAVKAFQQASGLSVDGVVGPQTLGKLFGAVTAAVGTEAASGPIVWYEEARRLLGLREGAGAADNPTILDWADDLDINYANDDIPWCGLFVAHCIGATLPDEPLPNNPLGARNWAKFGQKSDPAKGAILVFWRKSPQSGLGHVGFYHGEDAQNYHVLGGNQGDSVSVTKLAKNRLVAIRRPSTAGPLEGGAVEAVLVATVSTNEQ